MNSTLLKGAVAVIPETELLVNMVRLRVRQLLSGQRSLVVTPPGMGMADIALSEIAAGKLSSEAIGAAATSAPIVIAFPGTTRVKKAA